MKKSTGWPNVHWLTPFVMSLLVGYCTADCADLPKSFLNLPENTTDGHLFANISANNVTITREDNGNLFSILNVTEVNGYWEIRLHEPLDAETLNYFELRVKCSDNTNDEQLHMIIFGIEDVNEFAPHFPQADSTIEVSESEEVGASIFTVTATDLDKTDSTPQFQFVIINGSHGYFQITDSSKGEITLAKSLDYESGVIKFILTISAKEDVTDGKTNYTTLTINVEDTDDHLPQFSSLFYSLSIHEGNYDTDTDDNWFETTPVLSAWDGDLDVNQIVNFTISPASQSQYGKLFSVNENGLIGVNGHLSPGIYTVLIVAYQIDEPQLRENTTVLTITVEDGNNNNPIMNQDQYSVCLSEYTSPQTIILIVTAHDDDHVGNNSAFRFQLDTNNASGMFSVETLDQTGIIRLNRSLDREQKHEYFFQVWAVETLTKEERESNRSNVYITVLDENDNSPQFMESDYVFNIPRTNKQGDFVGQISATDDDDGVNKQLTYTIPFLSPGFTIDNDTGNITLNKNFSHSDIGAYNFFVQATDRAIPVTDRRTSFVEVTVNILPVNMSPPKFVNATYTFTALETATPGFLVGQVRATDDDGDVIQYTMSENEYLELNSISGNITLKKEVDMDSKTLPAHSIDIIINATDGLLNTEVVVKVFFLYVNDFPPSFLPTKPVSVFQNATVDTFIAQVKANDEDKGPDGTLTYSLITTTTSALFKIDPSTGEIKMNCSSCLSYRSYDIVVKVTDGGNPSFHDITDVQMNVEKTDFESPHFSEKEYHVLLSENGPAQILLQLSATDFDTAASELQFNGTYQTSGSTLIEVFKNGTVYINGSVDAEKQSYFVVDVSVTDGHSYDTAIIKVNITDENDNDPVLNITSLRPVSLPENTMIEMMVATVGATDEDVTNNGFSYFLTDGTGGKFQIDVSTGVITLTEPLDRKQKSLYNITVNVLDHGVPPALGSGNLIVTVNDSNTAPYFVDASHNSVSKYDFDVEENVSIMHVFGSLYACDPDIGSSGDYYFKLQPGDSTDVFLLDKDSGNLTLARALNYEERNRYILTAFVIDKSYEPKSASATVTINVINVEEPPLWPQPLPTVYITESSICRNQQQQLYSFSQEVLSASSSGNSYIEYNLLNMKDEFSINETSGLLKIINSLPEEFNILGVSACNNGTNMCSNVTLMVVRKMDDILAFCPAYYTVAVNESVNVNFPFLNLTTTKPDSTLFYNISDGNKDNKFGIGENDGKLYISEKLDREKTQSYILLISVKDTDSQEEDYAQVVIIVLDAPDSPPTFSEMSYQGQILESQKIGAPVLSHLTNCPLVLLGTDKDEFDQLSYRIDNASDTSNGSFSITANAEIKLAKIVDYENIPVDFNKSYTFKVLLTDGVFVSTATVTVHIQDANDNPPYFDTPGNLYLNVTEGSTSVQDLANITASDVDTQTRLIYSVAPTGVPKYFYIDGSTGTLSVIQELDHEVHDVYILNVTVTDGKYTNVKLVTVTVIDVNDNSPQFNQTFKMTVIEGEAGLGTNISVAAFDSDSPPNAELTYRILLGDTNQSLLFDIVNKNVLKTVVPLDREAFANDEILLTIEAVDSGHPPRTGTGSVIVTIKDVNDNPPQFSQNIYYGSVPDDAINVPVTLNTSFFVTNVDTDDCQKINYTLSTASTPFIIDKESGTLYVNQTLDRDTEDMYTLLVTAVDDCGNGMSSSVKIIIQITDASDKAPYFLANYSFEINKTSTINHVVGTLTAKDDNTGTIIYRLNRNNMFYIDPLTGIISLIGHLESETTEIYVLNASACNDKTQCGFVTVYISVTDKIHRCPSWNVTTLKLSVMENQTTGPIGHISVLDNEVSIASNIKYFLIDTGTIKYIEINISGEVTLLKVLKADKSDINIFNFWVYAEDKSQPSCIQNGTLELTVTGTNDNDPEICYQGLCRVTDIELSVFDESPPATLVALISARDNDTDEDGEITLNLTFQAGGPQDLFSLAKNGIISLNKQINITDITVSNGNIQNDTIELLLLAKDNGLKPRFANATIKVKVIIRSPNIHTFTEPIFIMNVKENENIGTYVGTVTTTAPDASLNYSISTPIGNLPFAINQRNGTITTTNILDKETQDSYVFTVEAIDSSQQKLPVSGFVMVTVKDINEPPTFDIPVLTVQISEGTTTDELLTLKAYDPDEGNNGILKYNLLNASSYSNFELNQTTGVLSVRKPLDRENISSFYLSIQAMDGGIPELKASVVVHVTVTDINDNPPKFSSLKYECNITKSDPPVKVFVVTANDNDEGINRNTIYSLESEWQTFKINPLTGEIQTIAVPRLNSYTIVVVASDQGNQSLTDTTTITVRVIDITTNIEPFLFLSTSDLPLFVGMTTGTQLRVTITTRDVHKLDISGANVTDTFKLEDGKIFLKRNLEMISQFFISITATSTTGQSVSKELVIQVDKLKFGQQSYSATVPEIGNVPKNILDIDSYAELAGIPVIYLLRDDFNSAFYINRSTGVLWVQKSLDRETLSVYALTVILSIDNNSTSSTGSRRKRSLDGDGASVNVLVKVDDLNDNVPSFDNFGPELLLTLPESVNASYLITTLKAFDPDEGFNGLIHYSISDGDSEVFSLDPVNGELRVASPEKLKGHISFMLTVQATDKNGTGNNSSLKISIKQDGYVFRLPTPLTVINLKDNLPVILKGLSQLLGYRISVEEVTVHEESGNVYPDRSDILFRAYDQDSMNTTIYISSSQIAEKVSEHQGDIEELFKPHIVQPYTADEPLNTVSKALIAVACFLFIVTLLAFIISYRMWKKQKKNAEKEKNNVQFRLEEQLKEENEKRSNINSEPGKSVEMTSLSRASASTLAVTPDTRKENDYQQLHDAHQSFGSLTRDAADSGTAIPLNSGSERESPEAVQNRDDNSRTKQQKLKQIPTPAASTVPQNHSSHSPLSQSSIRSKSSSTSYSNGVLPHSSGPDLSQNRHLSTGDNIIDSSIMPEIRGVRFQDAAYKILNNEDKLSEIEAHTHF